MKRTLFLLIVALLVLVLAGSAAAEGNGPSAATLNGTFYTLHGDPQDATLPPMERYFLFDEAGIITELLLDPVVIDVRSLEGRQVTVNGSAESLPGALLVDSIQVTPDARPTDTPLAAEMAYTSTWVTLGCKFADMGDEPRTVEFFRSMYGDQYPLLSHFWLTSTYGMMAIDGDAAGWFTMPRPYSDYFYASGSPNFSLLYNDCTAAADPFVNFAQGEDLHLALAFNADLAGGSWGGRYSGTLDGQYVWGVTWLPPWGYRLSTFAHEMGHAYGRYHSRHSNPELGVYSNPWDLMSSTWSNCELNTDPVYGCIPQRLASLHNDELSFTIPTNRTYFAREGTQTVVLEDVSDPTGGGYLAATIADYDDAEFYWLEVRSREGYDLRLPGEGVIIHRTDFDSFYSGVQGYLIDRDPWGSGYTDSAIWSPGEVFASWDDGVIVRVLEQTASGGYRLEIVSGADRGTVEIQPTDDTYVDSAQPTTAFGSNAVVHTRNGTPTRRAYFKFDVAALPDTIAEARLKLTPSMVETGARFGRVFAAPCTFAGLSTPWTESSLTWNNAPPASGYHPLDEITAPASVGAMYGFSIPGGIFGNDQLCFVVEANTNYLIQFSSAEGSTPPTLLVYYLVPPDTTVTTTFTPTNDATVSQAKPKLISGAKPTLQVKDAAKDFNAYVKFNVTGLTGAVQSATLRLWVTNGGPDGGRVYSTSPFYPNTTTQWLETGLKWSNAPAIGGTALDSAGAVVAGQWIELDVTGAITGNGRASFALTNDSTNLVNYSSKEGAHAPELIVTTNDE